MFLFFHYFNYQSDEENWVIQSHGDCFLSLKVAKALLGVELNCKYELTKPLRISRGHAFDQNGMFKNRPFKIEYG